LAFACLLVYFHVEFTSPTTPCIFSGLGHAMNQGKCRRIDLRR
jgi:hypothetical protein